jgi:hypothetical protein
MTPEQFTYWLQGFVEIRDKEAVGLTEKQWDIIKDHLQTVFHKVTPTYPPLAPSSEPYPYITPNGTGTPPNWNTSTVIC